MKIDFRLHCLYLPVRMFSNNGPNLFMREQCLKKTASPTPCAVRGGIQIMSGYYREKKNIGGLNLTIDPSGSALDAFPSRGEYNSYLGDQHRIAQIKKNF